MSNVPKYLLALESIDLTPDEKDDLSRIRKNIEILEKYIGSDLKESPVEELYDASFAEATEPEWKYSLYVYHLVLSVISGVKFDSEAKEDLISTKHLNLLIESIQDVSVYGLRTNLHSLFRTHRVFGPIVTKGPANTEHLKVSLKVFRKVLGIRQLQSAGSLNEVIRDYIAGILSIIESDLVNESKLTESERKLYQSDLNAIWKETSKCEYFKNILLFKGLPDLPPALQKRLHSELLNKLMSKGGFANFVTTLLTQRTKADLPESEYFEVVANIVAHKGHSLKFHKCLIDQIFDFLKLCVANKNMGICMGAGLLTLRRLYELKNETRDVGTEKVRELFQKLSTPENIICGLIVMENSEFVLFCNFLFSCFCTSSVECLPSEMLTNFLPLLLSVYSYLPDQFVEKNHIRGAIIRCLANRSRTELEKIVTSLVAKKYPDNWVDLHPRVFIRSNEQFSELTVKIISPDAQLEPLSISNVLPELLISSKHSILTHVVFMCLLNMMQEVLLQNDESTEKRIELLQDEQELITFLNTEYPVKVEIVLCLSALIAHPSLRSQVSENSGEFLDVLRKFIQQRSTQCLSNQESIDHTLLLMLTVTQEMIENSDIPEKFRDFSKVLRELLKQTPNELVIHRINKLLELLEGGLKASAANKSSQYNMARDLIKSPETHLKVYGINLMIEMLRRKEKDALANVHITLALALHVLKDKESYAFLNCVRLLVALVHAMEAEVLETLSDEYLNEDNKMDYRLLVGEAMLKVTIELNQLSYKYKDVLLNCFIHGCRSEVDEFRWSSFSNLATLCRTLTFQVHKFFQEMLVLVENEIQSGAYLPAKRAAVLVLSELLLGIENLLDHEEYLLPIYRVLKTLSSESDDEKIRIHAANGLKALGEKCKKFLIPDEKLQKEIKILGINDPPSKKATRHILELN